jgi:hypothetical protein
MIRTLDLSHLNWQEAFDKSVAGLARQGFQRAMRSETMCAYLAPNGFKCAVGHLDDANVLADMHGSWDSLNKAGEAQLTPPFPHSSEVRISSETFMRELQNAHDSATAPAQMRLYLYGVAVRFDLVPPPSIS